MANAFYKFLRKESDDSPDFNKFFKRLSLRYNAIYYDNHRLYIPDNENLKNTILVTLHDSPDGGHFGQSKTLNMITRFYWWPDLKKIVKSYDKIK